uniref:Uncharacterized protein n=1 Tax=Timema genevievae TaxID=629358 RepID=A0A7R9JTW2_TIMGE|nr:unnamed protein product [Timema genevievae]
MLDIGDQQAHQGAANTESTMLAERGPDRPKLLCTERRGRPTKIYQSVANRANQDIAFNDDPPYAYPYFFLYLEQLVEKTEEPVKGRSAEEESFFNQPAPSSAEKRQLTKDSILALYATQPTQPVSQQPIFGIPGGLYTQPSSGFPTAAPGLGYGISNSMMGAQPIQNGVYAVPGLGSQPLTATVPVPGIASNPFFNMGTPAAAFPVMSQLPQQFVNLNIGAPIEQPQPQGYMGLQGVTRPVGRQVLGRGMSDSLGELIMGPVQQPANSGNTLATNLWQSSGTFTPIPSNLSKPFSRLQSSPLASTSCAWFIHLVLGFSKGPFSVEFS